MSKSLENVILFGLLLVWAWLLQYTFNVAFKILHFIWFYFIVGALVNNIGPYILKFWNVLKNPDYKEKDN